VSLKGRVRQRTFDPLCFNAKKQNANMKARLRRNARTQSPKTEPSTTTRERCLLAGEPRRRSGAPTLAAFHTHPHPCTQLAATTNKERYEKKHLVHLRLPSATHTPQRMWGRERPLLKRTVTHRLCRRNFRWRHLCRR